MICIDATLCAELGSLCSFIDNCLNGHVVSYSLTARVETAKESADFTILLKQEAYAVWISITLCLTECSLLRIGASLWMGLPNRFVVVDIFITDCTLKIKFFGAGDAWLTPILLKV